MGKSILDNRKILIVDDETDVLDVIEQEIQEKCVDCDIDRAVNYEYALEKLQSAEYDLIILDIMGVQGFKLLESAVEKRLKTVMLTAHALTAENLKRAHDMGAWAYLPKQKLGEIVPFLEDVFKYEFEPAWKQLYSKLHNLFDQVFGLNWEKLIGVKWPEHDL